tara:strand:- start:4670 stop:4960 length:291 start_codon:yes stop_codon:yes gene_type:complete
MKKFNDLLLKLENKIELVMSRVSSLKNENTELISKNKILLTEKNEVVESYKILDEKFKAFKIANTISGSDNNINETRSEINSLIREIDLCISQLSD